MLLYNFGHFFGKDNLFLFPPLSKKEEYSEQQYKYTKQRGEIKP